MEREVLVNEIYVVCLELGVLKHNSNENQIKNNIRKQLSEVVFIENLYNTVFRKAKQRGAFHKAKVKKLLIELESLRLELEIESIIERGL